MWLINGVIEWSYANKEYVEAIGTLVGIFGPIVAFAALWVAYVQIRGAKRALQSGNSYNIQREAREIIQKLYQNPEIIDYIKNGDLSKDYDDDTIVRARQQIGLVFHFYLSVYRLALSKGITRPLSKSMGKDFLQFYSEPGVKAYYDKQMGEGGYDEEYQRMVEYWERRAR